MELAFLKVLNMSISASWLVMVVLALRFLIKKSPRWIHVCLWALVAVRLVCPISLESTVSLNPTDLTEQVMDALPDSYYGDSSIYSYGSENYDLAVSAGIKPQEGDNGYLYVITQKGNPTEPVRTGLMFWGYIWILGMAGMLLYALVSYLRLKGQVCASIHLDNGVYLCDYIDTPFILGILRPKIYLPSAMEPEAASHVLAHERSHILRKDHWWKPLGYVLLTLHWFNPVMWLAYILLCRDIELACDEKVVRQMALPQRKSYSDALLKCSVKRMHVAACPLAFGEVGVKERVKTVLNYKKPAFWIVLVAVVALIVTAVCFLTDPVEPQEEFLGTCYQAEKIVYRNPVLSYYMTEEEVPLFQFTVDGEMKRKNDTGDWENLGAISEIELTEESLTVLFSGEELGMEEGMTLAQLWEDNRGAWLVAVPNPNNAGSMELYLLLCQHSGEVYLGQGILCAPSPDPLRETPLDAISEVNWLYRLRAITEFESEQGNDPQYPPYTIGIHNGIAREPYYIGYIYWMQHLEEENTVTIHYENTGETAEVSYDKTAYTISDSAGKRTYQQCVMSIAESEYGTLTEYFFLTDDPEMTAEKYLSGKKILPTEVLYIDHRSYDAAELFGDVPPKIEALMEAQEDANTFYCPSSVFCVRYRLAMNSVQQAYSLERLDYQGNLLYSFDVKGVPQEILELEDGGFVVVTYSYQDSLYELSCYGASGELRWVYSFDYGGSVYIPALYEYNGDIYCFGTVTPRNSSSDIYIWRISPDGELVKEKHFTGSDFESIHRVLETDSGFTFYGSSQSRDGDFPFSKDGYGEYFVAQVSADLELLSAEKSESRYSALVGYRNGVPVFDDDPILDIGKKDNLPEGMHYGVSGIFDWEDGYVVVRRVNYEIYPYNHPLVSMILYYNQTIVTGYDAKGNPLWQTSDGIQIG